jgi:uncharacterized membrane protein YeaQ/YmgE (transglycosylase-associated protein family)
MKIGMIIHLVLAVIVGWIAQRLLGYREISFLTTLVVGLIGSFIGNTIARSLNLPYAFPSDTLQVWGNISIPYAVLGCILFIFIMNLIARGIPGEGEEG